MSNMSYCRFQNTASDFVDCVRNLNTLHPEDTHQNTDAERRARRHLIEQACLMIADLGIEDPTDEFEIDVVLDRLDEFYEPEED